MEIPTTVTSLDENCFYKCDNLRQLIIPSTIAFIPHYVFTKLPNLENLTIISRNYEIHGDRIFFVRDECLYSIELPKTVKKVNNQEMKPLERYTISGEVKRLTDYCFSECQELLEINGMETIEEIGKCCFFNCHKLNEEKLIVKQNKWEIYEWNNNW